jgi:hypothetical protein
MPGLKRLGVGALVFIVGVLLPPLGILLALVGALVFFWGLIAFVHPPTARALGRTLVHGVGRTLGEHNTVEERPPSPPPPQAPLPKIPFVPEYQSVCAFLETYRPSSKFGREREFQIEIAQALRGKFGDQFIHTEVALPIAGRIDIEACRVGVELELAGSSQALLQLPGQMAAYQRVYGPNLVAVILDDTGDGQTLTNVRTAMRQSGIRTIVKTLN